MNTLLVKKITTTPLLKMQVYITCKMIIIYYFGKSCICQLLFFSVGEFFTLLEICDIVHYNFTLNNIKAVYFNNIKA